MAANLKQYLRKWSLMINGQPFIETREAHQLRCVFDIEIKPQSTLAMADIQVYNLSKATNIPQRADISFSAGYQDNFDVLFTGTVTNVLRERRGPDVVTRLLCRHGSASERGLTNGSYHPGTKLTDVLTDVARAWPLYLEIDKAQFDDADVFPSGYTPDSDIVRTLNDLAYMFKFKWVPDRGTLVITRPDKERKTTVFDINQHTGMVGMPEVNRGPQGIGVNVTTRINPYIRATSRVKVQSEFSTYNTGNLFIAELAGDVSANGVYNVLSIHYTGDSHGDAWDMRLDALLAGSREVVAASIGSGLIWGARVNQAFRAKVREIAKRQNLDPNWYMAVMAFETGRSFLPWEPNKAGSGAVGLIQFMPPTARDLGTSTQALANMTAIEQLDYVEKYLQPYVSRIANIGDMYMAVFMPRRGIGMADSAVLIDRDREPIAYRQNASLDLNHDGKITRGEAVKRVLDLFEEGRAHMA